MTFEVIQCQCHRKPCGSIKNIHVSVDVQYSSISHSFRDQRTCLPISSYVTSNDLEVFSK